MFYLWLALGVVVAGALGLGVAWLLAARQKEPVVAAEATVSSARELFQIRREMLEARFLTLASQSGKPRDVIWVDCDFESLVCFARDKHTRQLRALVGVTIRFEAVEGGAMEDVPNVDNLKAATAVFRFENGQWVTDGRAIFNLNPAETIKHFQNELEMAE